MTKEWGNGMWTSIHIIAADASKHPAKFKTFVDTVTNLIKNIPCEECRSHATAYLQQHPLETCTDAFIWSWRFHNVVNKRLGKPEMDYETARNIFIGGQMRSLCKTADGKQCDQSDTSAAKPQAQTAIKPTLIRSTAVRSQFKARR